MRAFAFVLMILTATAMGCGGKDEIIQTPPPPPSEEQMATALAELAESGEPIGSGGMVIEEGIASVRERDPAKADELQKDYQALSSASNPAAVKSTAKSMLDKLYRSLADNA